MSTINQSVSSRHDSASNDTARPPPARSEDLYRPPKPVGETPSSRDVYDAVAERSQAVPTPEDSLALSAAAARYSLISLDSAKEIAREIRASVQSKPIEEVAEAASSTRHAEIADALMG